MMQHSTKAAVATALAAALEVCIQLSMQTAGSRVPPAIPEAAVADGEGGCNNTLIFDPMGEHGEGVRGEGGGD